MGNKHRKMARQGGKLQELLLPRHDEIPEVINRRTRRAAASMKRKQKENN